MFGRSYLISKKLLSTSTLTIQQRRGFSKVIRNNQTTKQNPQQPQQQSKPQSQSTKPLKTQTTTQSSQSSNVKETRSTNNNNVVSESLAKANVNESQSNSESNNNNNKNEQKAPKWVQTFENFYHLDFSGNSKRISQSQQIFHKTAVHCDLPAWYKPLTKQEIVQIQELQKQMNAKKKEDTKNKKKEEQIDTTRLSSMHAEVVSNLGNDESVQQMIESTNKDSKGETESVFATDMPPSFYSWYKITLLHMWLLFVRFRLFKKGGNEFSQALLDRFWEDMEFRQKGIGIKNPFVVSRNMKIFARQYYGIVVSLDEGLAEGDAVLADAIWRNVFVMREDLTAEQIFNLVRYLRRELHKLYAVSDKDLIDGKFNWGSPYLMSHP